MSKNVSLSQRYCTIPRRCETWLVLFYFDYDADQFTYWNAKLPSARFPKEMYINLRIPRGRWGSYNQCFMEAWRCLKHLELCDEGAGMLLCRRKELQLGCGGRWNGQGPHILVPLFTEQLILRLSWIFCCESTWVYLSLFCLNNSLAMLFCDVLWLRIASSLLDQYRGRDCIILVWFKVMSMITKVGQIMAAEIFARDGNG